MSNKIDPKWSKWLAASVLSFLQTNLVVELNTLEAGLGDSFQIKPEDELETDHENAQEWIELRVDGPVFDPSAGEYCLYAEINVLVCSLRNEANIYRHRSIRGCVENVLSRSICVYKYGDGDAFLGTMRLGRVVSTYLGELRESVVQSVCEVHGQVEFEGV